MEFVSDLNVVHADVMIKMFVHVLEDEWFKSCG
jgi:hypothetical protein